MEDIDIFLRLAKKIFFAGKAFQRVFIFSELPNSCPDGRIFLLQIFDLFFLTMKGQGSTSPSNEAVPFHAKKKQT